MDWLPWLLGGVAGLIFVLIAASVLALNMVRRTANITFTATSTSRPQLTSTSFVRPSNTPRIPTLTTAVSERTQPAAAPTLTPWPTNTVTVTSTP